MDPEFIVSGGQGHSWKDLLLRKVVLIPAAGVAIIALVTIAIIVTHGHTKPHAIVGVSSSSSKTNAGGTKVAPLVKPGSTASQPAGAAKSSPATKKAAPSSSTGSTSSSPSTSNPLAGLPTVAWYGGPAYWGNWPATRNAGWTNASFFPITAWFMRAADQNSIDVYKSLKINTDLAVEGSDDLGRLRANGMYAMPNDPTFAAGSESVGWMQADEADMEYGPGTDAWGGESNDDCIPSTSQGGQCGYTVMSTLHNTTYNKGDGRIKYANFGKGIWPGWEGDDQYSKFINSYTDAVSVDIYWYTDDNVCGGSEGPSFIQGQGAYDPDTLRYDLTTAQCKRAYNYGLIIDRMRYIDSLDGKRQPVWGFVETGCPGGGQCIQGPQIEGAVMASLIHGAAGINYFKHNFTGTCQTSDSFVDCGNNNANVAHVDGIMQDLAPVLNTQSYQYDFGGGTDTMLKWYNGSAYIFAMSKEGQPGTKTFTLPSGLAGAKNVQVMYENRNVGVSGGKFSDNFAAEYSYHIYKVTP